MSGGAYNYRSLQLGHLADEIEDDIETTADASVAEAMRHCVLQLRVLGELARSIEWYVSGDYGPEQVARDLAACRRVG